MDGARCLFIQCLKAENANLSKLVSDDDYKKIYNTLQTWQVKSRHSDDEHNIRKWFIISGGKLYRRKTRKKKGERIQDVDISKDVQVVVKIDELYDLISNNLESTRRDTLKRICERHWGLSMRGLTIYHKCIRPNKIVSRGKPFDFVKLDSRLIDALDKETKAELKHRSEKRNVFNCDESTYERLSDEQREGLSELPSSKSYTDKKRTLQHLSLSSDKGKRLVEKLQQVLRDNLCMDNVIENIVYMHTESGAKRQQFHTDFEVCGSNDNKRFVIVSLHDKQFLYIKHRGDIIRVKLWKGYAFVGHASLVHAGSEFRGVRIHFEFVPGSDEERPGGITHFVNDPSYPNVHPLHPMSYMDIKK